MWSEYSSVLLLFTVTTLLWFWMPKGVSSKAEVGRPKVKQPGKPFIYWSAAKFAPLSAFNLPPFLSIGWHQSLTLLFKLVRNRAVPLCELLLDFSRQFGNVLVARNPINGRGKIITFQVLKLVQKLANSTHGFTTLAVYCFVAEMPLAKSIMSSPGWDE